MRVRVAISVVPLLTVLVMAGGCREPAPAPAPAPVEFHDPWPDLEAKYASDWPDGAPSFALDRLVVYAPVSEHVPMNYLSPARIALTDDALWIDVEGPEPTRPLRIPVEAVIACGSSWFGGDDLHINVYAGDDAFMIGDHELLREWCWKSRKPALSDDVEDAWEYHGVLPVVPADDPQFASREVYDHILCPCLGR